MQKEVENSHKYSYPKLLVDLIKSLRVKNNSGSQGIRQSQVILRSQWCSLPKFQKIENSQFLPLKNSKMGKYGSINIQHLKNDIENLKIFLQEFNKKKRGQNI